MGERTTSRFRCLFSAYPGIFELKNEETHTWYLCVLWRRTKEYLFSRFPVINERGTVQFCFGSISIEKWKNHSNQRRIPTIFLLGQSKSSKAICTSSLGMLRPRDPSPRRCDLYDRSTSPPIHPLYIPPTLQILDPLTWELHINFVTTCTLSCKKREIIGNSSSSTPAATNTNEPILLHV